MNEIGEFSLLLALFFATYAMVVPVIGDRLGKWQMVASAEYALVVVFGLHITAAICLLVALYSGDFTLDYVYSYTNRDLNWLYKLSAFWAGQKGSLLF